MAKQFNVRLRERFDTLENWLASDTILLQGEMAIVVDKKDGPTSIMAKVGDGSTAFKDLPYISHPISDFIKFYKNIV